MDFVELEKAFPNMTENERDLVTSLHPLLDALSKEDAAYELSINERDLSQRLNSINLRFPSIWDWKKGI